MKPSEEIIHPGHSHAEIVWLMKGFGLLHALFMVITHPALPGFSPLFFLPFCFDDALDSIPLALLAEHDRDALQWVQGWLAIRPQDAITGDFNPAFFELNYGVVSVWSYFMIPCLS